MLKLKRAYEPAYREDGQRFLVERLWPRGVKKTSLRLDAWLKDVAPSTELRQWFGHDPKKWEEFRQLYRAERYSSIPVVACPRSLARQDLLKRPLNPIHFF